MRETGSYVEDVGISIFGPISARELYINTRGWDQTSKAELRTVWPESILDCRTSGQTNVAPWPLEAVDIQVLICELSNILDISL